jgi:hypothetical protein
VAQNNDLELALTAAAGEQTNETAEEPVQQTGQQDAQSGPPGHHRRQHTVTGESSFFTPPAPRAWANSTEIRATPSSVKARQTNSADATDSAD